MAIDDLYSAYDAHSEIEALLPDIEAALEMLDDEKSELSAMPSNEVLLQQVHNLRTMLINVGTGIARIQDVEEEYTRVRRDLTSKLRELGISPAMQVRP